VLVLLAVTTLIELFVVAFATAGFEEVADASPFGRRGTLIAAGLIAAVTVAGVLVAGRSGSALLRVITAVVVFLALGIVVVMALFFLLAGGTSIILVVLLGHTAVSIGLVGRAVLQSDPGLRTTVS
jgi:hypothetical protein